MHVARTITSPITATPSVSTVAPRNDYPGYPFPDEDESDDPTVPHPYNPCPGGFCLLNAQQGVAELA